MKKIKFFNKTIYVAKDAKVEIKGYRLFINNRLYDELEE